MLHERVYAIISHENVQTLALLPTYLLPNQTDLVFEEGHLGLDAKKVLKTYIQLCKSNSQFSTPAASFLAILASPENITAYNTRKNQVSDGSIDLSMEIALSALIMRSPLNRHCKSPNSWFHRRWLLNAASKLNKSCFDINAEWELVKTAAETHPMNYYAWSHLRWASQLNNAFPENLITELENLAKQHLSDVSIWSFCGWVNSPQLTALALSLDASFPGHAAIKSSILRS